MNKLYSRINWKNYPSEETALNETNLNKMDLALYNLDNRVIEMDATKVNKEVANSLVQSWSMDESTGIITITHLDGSKDMFDLNIEKIPVNFELSKDGILTMTTDDGSKFTANIGAMIPVLTFEDSDEIVVSVSGTGVNKTISFSIKAGSVTEDKLQPNFLADVKTEVAKAQASQESAAESASAASGSATLAESYTHGGTGAREGEDVDNARYYMEKAKAVSAVDIATTEKAGIVKPDGTTITVDEDGTLHGQSKVDEMTGATADADGTSGTVPAPKAGQKDLFLSGDGTWREAGTKITVDSELSKESENPVQNKTVTEELEKKINSDGDSKDLTTTYTSGDSANATAWTDVGLLTSGEKHSSLFQKIATMFKNIRYLYHMLGTADISTLGEGANIGTVTGALSKLNSDLNVTIQGIQRQSSFLEINQSTSFRILGFGILLVLAVGSSVETRQVYIYQSQPWFNYVKKIDECYFGDGEKVNVSFNLVDNANEVVVTNNSYSDINVKVVLLS